MKNWTIGKRIIIGGATLIALLIFVGGIGITGLNRLRSTVDSRIASDLIPGLAYGGAINNSLEEAYVRLVLAGQADTPKIAISSSRLMPTILPRSRKPWSVTRRASLPTRTAAILRC